MRRALFFSTGERYFGLLSGFVTIAIVSRLLTPSEIGVSVLGTAIMALAFAAREYAPINFIIQKKYLSKQDIKTAFTVLLLLTLLICAIVLASAELIAIVYRQDDLAKYIKVSLIGFPIDVMPTLVFGLLRREMRFDKVAAISTIGLSVGSATTIVLSLMGFSFMSMAWGSVAWMATCALLALKVWKDRSIFALCLTGWREMVAFGGYSGTNFLLYRIFDALPYIVFGRTLSVEAIALYNRAVSTYQLPDKCFLSGLEPVLMATFSAEARTGSDLRNSFLRGVELITAVQWPGLVCLAILAHPIVILVLGTQWLGVVPLVQIMALASVFNFTAHLNLPVLIAKGAMREGLIRSIVAWPISALIITGASLFGLKAAALAWFLTAPLQSFVSLYFVRRHVAVSWMEIASSLRRGAILTFLSAIGPFVGALFTAGSFGFGAAAAAITLSALGWSAGLLLTSHPLLTEIEDAVSSGLRMCGVNEGWVKRIWRLRKEQT
jgi:O-antigen/teichoic acid export membrane protein